MNFTTEYTESTEKKTLCALCVLLSNLSISYKKLNARSLRSLEERRERRENLSNVFGCTAGFKFKVSFCFAHAKEKPLHPTGRAIKGIAIVFSAPSAFL